MNITVSTPSFEVVSSGSIVSHDSETIVFQIEDLTFNIIFDSGDTESEENSSIFTKIVRPESGGGKGHMEIHMTNLKKMMNASTKGLLSLARIENRELLLKFAVTSINTGEGEQEDKVFMYTWYLRKEGK